MFYNNVTSLWWYKQLLSCYHFRSSIIECMLWYINKCYYNTHIYNYLYTFIHVHIYTHCTCIISLVIDRGWCCRRPFCTRRGWISGENLCRQRLQYSTVLCLYKLFTNKRTVLTNSRIPQMANSYSGICIKEWTVLLGWKIFWNDLKTLIDDKCIFLIVLRMLIYSSMWHYDTMAVYGGIHGTVVAC